MRDLLRLLRPLWPQRGRIALGVALSLATVLANIGLLALSSWFIASMAIAGALGATMAYALPAAAVRALAITRAAGRYAERLVNHDATFRILASLRLWFYRRVSPLAPARLAGFRSGDLLGRIRGDIDRLDDYYLRGLVPAAVALLACSCILPFLAGFDWRLALIDGLALATAGLAAPALLAVLSARPGAATVLASGRLRAGIVEEVEGMAELVALGAAAEHARLLDGLAADLDREQRRLASLGGIGDATMASAASLAVWAGSLVLVGLVSAGALPPADLAGLSVLILASFETILPLPAAIQKAGEMAAAARRLFEILDAEPAVAEPALVQAAAASRPTAGTAGATAKAAGATAKAAGATAKAAGATAGAPGAAARPAALGLRVRGLRFRYAPGLPTIFEALDLELPPGGILGLSGPSGAGKSSLVSLLFRFWDYEAGTIELLPADGGRPMDLRSFHPEAARAFFSVLPQSPFLYHASIRENLLLAALPGGEQPGPADEERLLDAVEAAQLSTLVARLPQGLDTIVGETGRAVSGGELQRIALARAFLKEAPICILDEPTEGLDDLTAEALLDAAARRLSGRSLLVISHRERDFRIADSVMRLGLDAGPSFVP